MAGGDGAYIVHLLTISGGKSLVLRLGLAYIRGSYSEVGLYTVSGVGLMNFYSGVSRCELILKCGLISGVGSYSSVGLYQVWAHTRVWAYIRCGLLYELGDELTAGVNSYSSVGLITSAS